MVVGRTVSVGQWIAKIASDWYGYWRGRHSQRVPSQASRSPERSGISMLLSELSTHAHPHTNPQFRRRIYRRL